MARCWRGRATGSGGVPSERRQSLRTACVVVAVQREAAPVCTILGWCRTCGWAPMRWRAACWLPVLPLPMLAREHPSACTLSGHGRTMPGLVSRCVGLCPMFFASHDIMALRCISGVHMRQRILLMCKYMHCMPCFSIAS